MRISGALIIDFQKKVSNRLRKSRIFRPFMKLPLFNQRIKDRRESTGSKDATFSVPPAEYAGMKKPRPRVISSPKIIAIAGRPAMNLKGKVKLVNRRKGERRGRTKQMIASPNNARKRIPGMPKK